MHKIHRVKLENKVFVVVLIKVTVKFIRRGIGRRTEKENIFHSPCRNESKDSKWWSPTPSFILESWGKYT
jgi:hypothetical protein